MSEDPKDPKEPKEPKDQLAAGELRVNEVGREKPTRVYKEAGGWITSPGMLELFRAAEWEFLKVAELRGMKSLELTHIRVANVEGETRVYLYPTKKTDRDRIEVKISGRRMRINLGPDLTRWGLALPIHHKERFDLTLADASESPVGPALYFDLAKPVQVKVIRGKGRVENTTDPAAPAGENQTPSADPRSETDR